MFPSRLGSKSPRRGHSSHAFKKPAQRSSQVESLERRHLLTNYMQMNLVSDQGGAALIQDPKLIAPWGIAEAANGNFWLADSGSSVATIYSVNGQSVSKVALTVDVPGGLPTGLVANSSGGFNVTGEDGSTGSSQFVFDSLNGNLAGWNPSVPNLGTTSTLAQLAAQVDGAVYTGLAIGTVSGTTYLYAADFQNGTIDVFDTNFDLVTSLPGNFIDPNLPANYSPFDVQVINGQLYVTYAQFTTTGNQANDNDDDDQGEHGPQDDAKGNGNGNGNGNGQGDQGDNGHGHHGPKPAGPHGGPGSDDDDDDHENGGTGPTGVRLLKTTGGIVDVFDLSGNFVRRLSTDGSLNAPWGMALAPSGFGQFAGDLLVGNFGDGRITALNLSTNAVDGQLTNTDGATISIQHLLGLTFGNQAATSDTLFFTSAPNGTATTTPPNPSLVVLDSSGNGALSAVGNADVVVSGGGTIAVDSNSSTAIVASGNAQIAAGTIDVVGSTRANGNANIDGMLDIGAAAVADPLASLAAPSTAGLQTFSALHISDHSHVTLQPGVYTGGIDVSGQASVLLMPGIYFLQGGGLRISGGATVVGNGVTIFNSPQNANDGISVTGHGSLTLTGPETGTYKGIAIFQSRGAGSPLDVDGQGSIIVQGIIYAPAATAEISGNGRLVVLNDLDDGTQAQLIVFDLNVVGNGTVSVSGVPVSGVHGLFGSLQAAGTTPLVALGGSFSATEGISFTGAVAALDATAAAAVAANFTATIDWGDGTTSAGTVTATGNGGFLVLGNHMYAEEGAETVTVTIHDNSSNTATTTAQVQVADAPLVAAGINIPVQQSLTVSNLQIASVTDTGGAEAATSYTTTIDWGDGSATSAGTVSVSGNTVNVVGSHTYALAGRYHVNVTVQDEGGASTVVHSIVIVGSPPPASLFVGSAFDDVLERPVDQQALQNFVNALQSGEPRGTFALTLTHSDEFLEEQIEQAYLHFLGRDADDAGMIFWLNMMKGGLTLEQLESQFIGSPEYYEHSGDTDLLWVDHMYFDLLGRAPDTAGETFWVNALAGGEARALVALGFANSNEHESIIVRDDYETYLDRLPAPSEVNYWVSQFEQGVNNENVVAGFVASDEYFETHGHE